MSSATDWVALTISPRWNSTCTSDAGSTPIFSARSVRDAPRRRRTFCPSPERIRTPPIVGASIWSNSARRALRLLRPRRAWPPRPKAPWVPPRPPRPRPPPPTGPVEGPPPKPGRLPPAPPPPPGRPRPGPPAQPRVGRWPAGLSWLEACLGIIAGFGRGMPPVPPGRGMRGAPPSPPGRPGAPGRGAPPWGASGRARRTPMPWLDANGLLPGRGEPVGRGARDCPEAPPALPGRGPGRAPGTGRAPGAGAPGRGPPPPGRCWAAGRWCPAGRGAGRGPGVARGPGAGA